MIGVEAGGWSTGDGDGLGLGGGVGVGVGVGDGLIVGEGEDCCSGDGDAVVSAAVELGV